MMKSIKKLKFLLIATLTTSSAAQLHCVDYLKECLKSETIKSGLKKYDFPLNILETAFVHYSNQTFLENISDKTTDSSSLVVPTYSLVKNLLFHTYLSFKPGKLALHSIIPLITYARYWGRKYEKLSIDQDNTIDKITLVCVALYVLKHNPKLFWPFTFALLGGCSNQMSTLCSGNRTLNLLTYIANAYVQHSFTFTTRDTFTWSAYGKNLGLAALWHGIVYALSIGAYRSFTSREQQAVDGVMYAIFENNLPGPSVSKLGQPNECFKNQDGTEPTAEQKKSILQKYARGTTFEKFLQDRYKTQQYAKNLLDYLQSKES